MADNQNLEFKLEPSATPVMASERSRLLENPGFGTLFTDHMAMIRYSEAQGWHDARITKREPILMDPASSVLHYAQEIFEGMKAYRLADGSTALFRPEANAKRFQASARRMAMPELPQQAFLDSVEALVDIDRDWFPSVEGGSLYLRPFMFASEVFLGVRPAKEYLYLVIASPAGGYFKSGASAISIWGLQDRPIAIMTRWRIPPESWCGYSLARCSGAAMPTRRSISMARLWASERDTSWCNSTASAIWRPQVITGLRLVIGSWKIIATSLPRTAHISSSERSSRSRPLMRIAPPSILPGGSLTKRMIDRAVTDLPQPLSPTKPRVSAAVKSKETPSTAFATPVRVWK